MLVDKLILSSRGRLVSPLVTQGLPRGSGGDKILTTGALISLLDVIHRGISGSAGGSNDDSLTNSKNDGPGSGFGVDNSWCKFTGIYLLILFSF